MKKFLPLFGIIALGALTAFLGWYYLSESEKKTNALLIEKANIPMTNVVVPIKSFDAGTIISVDMVALRPVPSEFVQTDALTIDTFEKVAGQAVTLDVQQGVPLLASFFSTKSRVFSEQLEVGIRAITIPVDEISSISGLLRAGDRIDFMFVAEQKSTVEEGFVVPLLQDVVVRATGKITAEEFASRKKQSTPSATDDPYSKQSYSTVTVGIAPKDAQKLILAQRMGKIIAALRNPTDREKLSSGTNESDLVSSINALRAREKITRNTEATKKDKSEILQEFIDVEYIIGGAGNASQGNSSPTRSALKELLLASQANTGKQQTPSVAARTGPSEQEQQSATDRLYQLSTQ